MMTLMSGHTLTTSVIVMVTVVTAATCTTFLSVAQDLAPPPLTNSSAATSTTTLAHCGRLCFAAGVARCLAFVWRPLTLHPPLATTINISNNNSSSGGGGVRSEGRCELLRCLPHPASLTPSPGAQLFLVKVGPSSTPPPAFTTKLVPASYTMACTFAFRVFTTVKLGHRKAARHCRQDGARLAVYKSPEEEAQVRAAVNPQEPYWIGLSDRRTEGVWRWADRTNLTYSNWDSGQPNNYVRAGEDQDCGVMYKGHWNDHQCRDSLRFICQVPIFLP